jgi:hypothetical protein
MMIIYEFPLTSVKNKRIMKIYLEENERGLIWQKKRPTQKRQLSLKRRLLQKKQPRTKKLNRKVLF